MPARVATPVATPAAPPIAPGSPATPGAGASGGSAPRVRTFRAALSCAGLGMTVIVVLDGSWPWRIARLLLVGALVSRAMGATRRDSRLAVTAIVVAVLSLPVGATIAFSYLPSTGVSLRALAGVLTALGGLGLLVVGLTTALHARRWWWRALVVALVIALFYGVAFPLVIAVYATNVPRPALGRVTPAARGFVYRDAVFVTDDGVALSGWYIPSRNRAAVVLLHGASSTRSNVLDQAVVLARRGYGVLLFDARGHGRSAGRAMELGWYGDRDVSAAVTYLGRQSDVDPARIAALGISMGGEEAIGAMAHDARLRAVVAEGATNRVAGDWSWLADRYGLRGRVQQGVQWLTMITTDLLTAAAPPITLRAAVAAAAPRPVLLITAGTVADEGHAGAWIRSGAPATVSVWNVPGARHGGALRAQPVEWERRVATFLDRALLGPTS